MLFSKIQEINKIIPTAKIAKIDNLLPRLCTEEMNTLYPLTGEELLQQMNEDYDAMKDELWEEKERTDENRMKMMIIRMAQEVILYMYLANNSAILQSSLNIGGGWNSASTDNYEALDDKENTRLDRDLWNCAKRAKENLLLLLEMDAKANKVYTEKWKNSNSYYMHENLLFSSAADMHPMFINLGDCPHLNFQKYISLINDCQDGYIAGAIGEKTMQQIIRNKTEKNTGENEGVWNNLSRHVKTALANFIQYEHDGAKHEHLKNRGEAQLTLARRILTDNYSIFKDFLVDTPLYKDEESVTDEKKKEGKKKKYGTVFSLLN